MSAQSGSRRRWALIHPAEYNEEGARLCRWCHGPIEGQGVYCGQACRDAFLIRRSPIYAARRYREMNGSRCVGCGADEQKCLLRYQQALSLLAGTSAEGLLLPFEPWQMDHIRPVADGGGECGLENYRLLCPECHKGVTLKFLQDRRARRKSASAWQARARSERSYRRPLPPRSSR